MWGDDVSLNLHNIWAFRRPLCLRTGTYPLWLSNDSDPGKSLLPSIERGDIRKTMTEEERATKDGRAALSALAFQRRGAAIITICGRR